MKKILYILIFTLSLSDVSFAQDDDQGGKLRDKMIEYIQNRLSLSRSEAEKFQPVFLDYLKDMRNTKQQFNGDKLILQQKIVDLRIRYRDQFKPIMGEKRSNAVFQHEREFVEKAIQERNERLQNRPQESRANKKTGLLQ
jgi:ribosomal protein L16 Arg81 hydroxylase